jgi:hypothetical protein
MHRFVRNADVQLSVRGCLYKHSRCLGDFMRLDALYCVSLALLYTSQIAAFGQVKAEPTVCPTDQGVYANVADEWQELSVETSRRENHTIGNLAHDNVVAYYPGGKSHNLLNKDVVLCISGSALGSTFTLAKAQEKKDERRVIVGTYSMLTGVTFRIDKKYSVAIQLVHDKNRNYIVRTSGLESGQYMLYILQGSSVTSIPPAFSFGV